MRNIRRVYQRMQLFERICMAYSEDLQKFIYALTRKDQFAMEEIFQNTMVGALKGLPYLRDNKKMRAWIFAIARAEAKRYYAASLSENSYGQDKTIEVKSDRPEHLFDFTKSIEEKEFINALIESLSDEEGQLCVLHYYYDFSLKEISEILNVNYNTIRSMHIRGMGKLRKRLTDGEIKE